MANARGCVKNGFNVVSRKSEASSPALALAANMPDFEMLSSEKIEFNNGGEFIELSINLVKDNGRETPYLRLARGYYSSEGEPRYKKGGATLPIDREVLNQLAEALKVWDITDAVKRKGAAGPAPAKAAKGKKPASDDDEA
jgi:hypothetical protein